MDREDVYVVCQWQRENSKRMMEGQFHQDLWSHREGKETRICHYQIYFGNLKKYLPKKVVCMLSYKYLNKISWVKGVQKSFLHSLNTKMCYYIENIEKNLLAMEEDC